MTILCRVIWKFLTYDSGASCHEVCQARKFVTKHKLYVRKSSAAKSWHISCYQTGQECPVGFRTKCLCFTPARSHLHPALRPLV
jgi:hypothetical protein